MQIKPPPLNASPDLAKPWNATVRSDGMRRLSEPSRPSVAGCASRREDHVCSESSMTLNIFDRVTVKLRCWTFDAPKALATESRASGCRRVSDAEHASTHEAALARVDEQGEIDEALAARGQPEQVRRCERPDRPVELNDLPRQAIDERVQVARDEEPLPRRLRIGDRQRFEIVEPAERIAYRDPRAVLVRPPPHPAAELENAAQRLELVTLAQGRHDRRVDDPAACRGDFAVVEVLRQHARDRPLANANVHVVA